MFLLYAFLFLLLPLHKARQEAKRLQLKFHIMNKEKLEELETLKSEVIFSLKIALGDIYAYGVDDSRFYDAIIDCINNVEEAKESLENIQIELDKETEEGQ